ncbi:hypothetical protein CYLTODRAFT_473453, partial [Cylindrobasidium torrendii FP15055 ss-10]
DRTAGIPWGHLASVTNRIPKLQSLSLTNLFYVPPKASVLRSYYADIFLNAPSLLVVNLVSSIFPLNLPWRQLEDVSLNYTAFDSYRQFADHFALVMTRTTAPAFSWGENLELIEDVDNIAPTLQTVENHCIVDIRIPPMILPPVLLPKLTALHFVVSDSRDECLDSVSQVVTLLKNSDCHLLHLKIEQWPSHYTGDVTSIAPLLPYLTSLQSLNWVASMWDEDVAINLLTSLHNLLVNLPVRLPALTSLTLELYESIVEEAALSFYSFGAFHAGLIWNIVQSRMLNWDAWPVGHKIVKLEHFYIEVKSSDNENAGVEVMDEGFKESQAWSNIKAADVDFRF